MPRFISPPLNEIPHLRQKLQAGELELLQFLNRHLPAEWEIFVQPPLNGNCPDFVLLNVDVGIVVIEVKDWNLSSVRYTVEPGHGGNPPRLVGMRDGKKFQLNDENPFLKLRTYREELLSIYCPSPTSKRVVYGVVVFTRATRDEVDPIYQPYLNFFKRDSHNFSCCLACLEDIQSEDVSRVIPVARFRSRSGMSAEIATDLRHWLIEPHYRIEQRERLEHSLSRRQLQLVTSRTDSGYRRIRGPAGSGKSALLAARAGELCSHDKRVMVVTYNITILNYLQDLCVRWRDPRKSKPRTRIEWLHFHALFKRICFEAGLEAEYKNLWHAYFEDGDQTDESANRFVQQLFERAIESLPSRKGSYDAILVDEGQDLHPEWWQCIRQLLKPDGEMVLVADATQDIYRRTSRWTEDAMRDCGFRGNWVRLEESYRLPGDLHILLKDFAGRFLDPDKSDVPEWIQAELQGVEPFLFNWVQTNDGTFLQECANAVIEMAFVRVPNHISVTDVTFVVNSTKLGRKIVACLAEKDILVTHTFDRDYQKQKSSKQWFYRGDDKIKGTTIHSFKGLETSALVICIEKDFRGFSPQLVYTALSRLKRRAEGCFLTIVTSEPSLAQFGEQWSREFHVTTNASSQNTTLPYSNT